MWSMNPSGVSINWEKMEDKMMEDWVKENKDTVIEEIRQLYNKKYLF